MEQAKDNRLAHQSSVIGFSTETRSLEDWLSNPHALTEIFSISGIGGIGKSTLLMEMSRLSRRSSAITLWLDGKSDLTTPAAFLTALEMSLDTEYGRARSSDAPLLSYVSAELSRQRTVLLIDNCEEIDTIEGWFLSSFLPKLEAASVLFVMASRKGLPIKWLTSPRWGSRIHSFPLPFFTREEVHEYLRRSGLDSELQIEIAQKTEGHPLLLALTVDLLRRHQEASFHIHDIPSIISAELLREVANPDVYLALTVLAFLPEADRRILNFYLNEPLKPSDYDSLTGLSFVSQTAHGLSLHHVISRLLREDYASRYPLEFQELRQSVLMRLSEQFHVVNRRQQSRISSHILELYREYLPASHAYAHFPRHLNVGRSDSFQAGDLTKLHQLLDVSLADSNWQSELIQRAEYHPLLDDIAEHCPEGIFVIRGDKGEVLAFCAGLWLHEDTVSLLKRYSPEWLEVLGEEVGSLSRIPAESADSISVLLAAVDTSQSLYHPEELGAVLMQQWLIRMASGLRGIMVAADPQLNQLFHSLGFRMSGRISTLSIAEASHLTKWELDFRHTSFDEWVQLIIDQTGKPAAEPATQQEESSTIRINEADMKRMLTHLFHSEQWNGVSGFKGLNRTPAEIRKQIISMLEAEPPPSPLTRLEQSLLREGYVQKNHNKNQLAADFHMSRTTFYRHSKKALLHLAQLLERILSSNTYENNGAARE